MNPQEVSNFFQGFNFDTLIAVISCIAGIIALFLGGTSYNKCKRIENSFNDKKEFKDFSTDYSQKAGRDIIINTGYDEPNMIKVTTALAEMNKSSFSQALAEAYNHFERQTENNLKRIIAETNSIIQSKKLEISGYTKIDWINVYFESAKNSYDSYMQSVWAKVLAQELSKPDSFSYKTLDVLRNMSSVDFKLFEKLCSMQIDGNIMQEDISQEYKLEWVEKLKLKEFGLLSLERSQRIITIKSGGRFSFVCGTRYIIILHNKTTEDVTAKFSVWCLTNAARELNEVAEYVCKQEYIIGVARELQKIEPDKVDVYLHRINYIKNGICDFETKNLLSDNSI